VFIADQFGFDVGFQPLVSPTHALILFLALLPLCPPLRPIAWRRYTFPAFAVALSAALGLSAYFLFSFEEVYVDPKSFAVELALRNALIAIAAVLLALSLRRGRAS
jgi:hypothetical protein